ncbi:AEC family transporter [Faecalibacillus intestinalis]|jgi:predicted permease|uniref:AEC family transporter n=2 Tax=Faecalibacillus intestinalis TaxID=1982626 RepID=UPI000E50F479|nr:AEC family transporter [Faecalibacillus intestinalis]RGG28881.1 AEC family transporter [Coprobacillus sp. AF24-1LB]RGG77486.1 AEC family transporter [Coprobacillus sp. AF17-17AC]RGG81825.1 AEC family transporter [Coprobacillus sp. AF17-11AC]RHP52394.1 AEC family transporter [Coprobacillus sp. AF31-1BH]RHP72432.1 AEC family transporter [Coprobacillus sp. OF03-2AA]
MDIMVVFQTMLKLFLLLVLGFVLFKCHIFDEYTNKKISALIVNVASPMLIISSIAGVEGSNKSIVFLMIGAGILMYIGFIILGKIINRIFPFPKKDWPVYECMVVFANTGFMGYPVLLDVFGQEAVFYASLIHMAFNFFVYTYAIMCLTKGDDSEFKLNFKQLLTPGIILIFVGIFIYLFDIQLPSVLMDTINSVGSLTAPLSMMMIGSSLAVYPIKDSFTDWRSYVFAFVRLMIVPFVTMIMCRLLHIDAYYANITIITNAMPVGSMVLMLATQYNANVKIVTRNIVVSTLLSVITIPIVVATMLL